MITYFNLEYGMHIKFKSGRVTWRVFAVCCDRVIYQSVISKKIRTLKRLKHSNKTFIDVSESFVNDTFSYCPF